MFRPRQTDADGRYEMPGFTPKEEGKDSAYAEAPGYSRAHCYPEEDGTADFALHSGDAAVGRILSADGEPVTDASVVLLGMTVESPGSRGADVGRTRSGPDGRFRIDRLRHDIAHTLLVEARGHAKLVVDVPPAVEEGGTADLGDQRIYASGTAIMFARKVCYCFVRPRRSFLELWIFLGRTVRAPQIRRSEASSRTKVRTRRWRPRRRRGGP